MILAWLQARFWQLAAAAAIAGSLWAWGYAVGHGKAELAHAEQRATDTENAMLNSHASALRQARIQGTQDETQRTIDRELLLLIDSLRPRPAERLPASAAATCKGATGLNLARPDAEFLARYSAERKSFIAEIIACRASEDNLRELLESARAK